MRSSLVHFHNLLAHTKTRSSTNNKTKKYVRLCAGACITFTLVAHSSQIVRVAPIHRPRPHPKHPGLNLSAPSRQCNAARSRTSLCGVFISRRRERARVCVRSYALAKLIFRCERVASHAHGTCERAHHTTLHCLCAGGNENFANSDMHVCLCVCECARASTCRRCWWRAVLVCVACVCVCVRCGKLGVNWFLGWRRDSGTTNRFEWIGTVVHAIKTIRACHGCVGNAF